MSISFKQARRRLPEAFMERLYNTYTQSQAESVLRGFMIPRVQALRVNPLLSCQRRVEEELKEARVQFQKETRLPEAFVLPKASLKDLQKLPGFDRGHFYIQGLASQIPPRVLNPRSGMQVLDIAAAPGSKTTQMAGIMRNKGFILANEKDTLRHERLQFNLHRQGADIVRTRLGDGGTVDRELEEGVDRILLDVPCSGEGGFHLQDAATYRNWSSRLIRDCLRTQRRLLRAAERCLKPGGEMVYSTCTLNPQENESMIRWFLDSNPDFELQPIELAGFERLPSLMQETHEAWTLCPTRHVEGFFVAHLKRR